MERCFLLNYLRAPTQRHVQKTCPKIYHAQKYFDVEKKTEAKH